MYAMSVSPLRKEWLARISPRLEGLLSSGGGRGGEERYGRDGYEGRAGEPRRREGGREGGRSREEAPAGEGQSSRKDRDFTNKVKIGSEVFDLVSDKKKKKVVDLEWSKLKTVRDEIDRDDLARFKGMKGTILVGKRKLLQGEKLDVILKIAPWLDPEADLKRDWPRKKNFTASEDLHGLLASLQHVLQVSEAKAKGNELGFIALFSDTEGTYWFRCSRGFHTALNESIASLESLADRLGDDASPAEKEAVSALYRKLTSFFE